MSTRSCLAITLAAAVTLAPAGCSDGTARQASEDQSEQQQLQDAMSKGFQKPIVKKARAR